MTTRQIRLSMAQEELRSELGQASTTVHFRHLLTQNCLRHLRWRDRFTLATRPEWAARPGKLRAWLLSRR